MRRPRERAGISLGKKIVLAMTLAICCVLCGCGHNAKRADVVVEALGPTKIVGILPQEVSRVNGLKPHSIGLGWSIRVG